jgi:hypothetical protein
MGPDGRVVPDRRSAAQLAWAAREMSDEDHAAFDAYTGPPASTWCWVFR